MRALVLLILLAAPLSAQLTVQSTAPQSHEASAAPSTTVSATFSASMAAPSLQSFRVRSSTTGATAGAIIGVGTPTLEYFPAAQFRPGETVDVTLTTALQDTSATALSAPRVFRFNVAATGGNASFGGKTVEVGPPLGKSLKVATGDLNGDGNLDLAFISFDGHNRYYFGDGAGWFGFAGVLGPGGEETRALALGDLDNDGDIDAVLGVLNSFKRPYLNDGAGNFTAGNVFDYALRSTRDVELFDANGDGFLDVAVANGGASNQNKIYLNDGAGNFFWGGAEQSWGPASTPTYAVAAADVDLDGDLDLIAADNGGDALYLNNGMGAFTSGGVIAASAGANLQIAVADLNGDNYPDYANGLGYVFLNNGGSGFTQYSTTAGPGTGVVLADFDGDGDHDLVCLRGMSAGPLYLNTGGTFALSGTVVPAGDRGSWGTAGDFDGDGDIDFATASFPNTDGQCRVYFNGDAAPTPLADFSAGLGLDPTGGVETLAAVTADFNGDSYPDVAVANNNTGSVIYLNSGRGTFPSLRYFSGAAKPSNSIAAGDLDGDSDIDLLLGNYGASSVVYLNNGSAVFSATTLTTSATLLADCSLDDVDGDSDLDIVLVMEAVMYVYTNNGSAQFTALAPIALSTTVPARCAATGDLNGDGYADVVIGSEANALRVLLTTGAAAWASPVSIGSTQLRASAIRLADLDGDSNLDIVSAGFSLSSPNGLESAEVVFWGNGAGGFPSSTGFGLGMDRSTGLEIADVDGDSLQDIIMSQHEFTSNDFNWVFFNDGSRGFARGLKVGGGQAHDSAPTAADFDGDSDIDIVFVRSQTEENVYFRNGSGPVAITTLAPLPAATQTVYWSHTFTAAAGQPAYSWSIANAPGWLSMQTGGLLEGTPPSGSAGSQVTFDVTVTDQAADSHTLSYSLTILPVSALVTGVSPSNGEAGVAQASDIIVDFNAPMNLPSAAMVAIRGEFSDQHSWSGSGQGSNTLTFDPAAGFTSGELVEVTITTQLQTTASTSLAAPYVWRFRAAAQTGPASFLRIETTSGLSGVDAVGTVADMDGDGALDIVISAGGTCHILLNDGYGGLGGGGSTSFTLPQSTYSAVRAFDLDSDGDLDLALAMPLTGTPGGYVYLNDGSLNFTAGPQLGVRVCEIEIGDVNGDGRPDVVTGGNSVGNNVYLNTGGGALPGAGGFGSAPSGSNDRLIELADLDNDGDLDVIDSNGAYLDTYLNNGSGVFTFYARVSGYDGKSLVTGDFNVDGSVDCVLAGTSASRVLWGNGGGGFNVGPSFGGALTCFYAADIAGAGSTDITCFDSAGRINVWNMAASPQRTMMNNVSVTGRGTLAADFDGDGCTDIAAFGNAGSDTDIVMFFNRDVDKDSVISHGPMTEPTSLDSVSGSAAFVPVFDFNIEDLATFDSLPTGFDEIDIRIAGTIDANLHEWQLNGPGLSTTVTRIVGSAGIQDLEFDNLSYGVQSGTTATFVLSVRLSNAAGDVTDGDNFNFRFGPGFLRNTFGSRVDTTLPDIQTAALTLDVDATQVLVLQQPPANVAPGAAFDVVAGYCDANGNIDTDVTGDVLTLARSDAGPVTAGNSAGASAGIADFTGANAVVLSGAAALGIQLIFTDDAAGVVDLSGSPAASSSLNLFLDDADSQLSAGSLTPPAALDSVASAASATAVFEFTISDSGASDGQPTAVYSLEIDLSGSTADAFDGTWTLSGPGITAVTGTPLGAAGTQLLSFVTPGLSVSDGASQSFTLSVQMAANPAGTLDNDQFEFAIAGTSITLSAGSTSFASGTGVTGWPAVPWSVSATALSVSQQPPASVTQGMQFSVVAEFVDVSGNRDLDIAGDLLVATRSDGGTVIFGLSLPAVAGVASFTSGNQIVLGGPNAQGIQLLLTDDAGGAIDLSTSPLTTSVFNLGGGGGDGGGGEEGEGCTSNAGSSGMPLQLLIALLVLARSRRRKAQ